MGTIRRDRPTGTHLGMAHTGDDSRAGAVQSPPSMVQQNEAEPTWVQFGLDHAGPWICTKRTDAVTSLDYEVPYVDPEPKSNLQFIPY